MSKGHGKSKRLSAQGFSFAHEETAVFFVRLPFFVGNFYQIFLRRMRQAARTFVPKASDKHRVKHRSPLATIFAFASHHPPPTEALATVHRKVASDKEGLTCSGFAAFYSGVAS